MFEKKTAFETKWSAFLPIAFFFIGYNGPLKLTLGTFICLVYAMLCIAKYGIGHIFKPLVIYTAYLCCYFLYCAYFGSAQVENLLFVTLFRYPITTLIVMVVSQHIDFNAMYKTWKVLSLIVCAVLLVQVVQIHVLHQTVSTIVLIPGQSGGQLVDVWGREINRPVTFFTEPAMEVAFLAPMLFFSLIKEEKKLAYFLSICILLTTSTTGLVVLAIIWGIQLFNSEIPRSQKLKYAFVALIGVLLFFTLPVFHSSVEKLQLELSGESSNAFSRVYSGWMLYENLDMNGQIFGLPDFNFTRYIKMHGGMYGEFVSQSRMADEDASFFFNTAQHVMLRSGIIGGVLYSYMLLKLYKGLDKIAFPYFMVIVVSMFFELSFFSHNAFVMQYIILLSFFSKNQFSK